MSRHFFHWALIDVSGNPCSIRLLVIFFAVRRSPALRRTSRKTAAGSLANCSLSFALSTATPTRQVIRRRPFHVRPRFKGYAATICDQLGDDRTVLVRWPRVAL